MKLTPQALAEQLGVTKHTIYRWTREGVITPVVAERSITRFDLTDVMATLKARAKKKQPRALVY